MLKPFVRTGMMVLEPGPGMGFFTLELARLVGPEGRVIAVDVQSQMIAGLRRRAERAGVINRIETRISSAATMGLEAYDAAVDFVLAFAVVHEMPSAAKFFVEAARAMKSGEPAAGRTRRTRDQGRLRERTCARRRGQSGHS